MKLHFRKLNSRGVAHHALIAIIVIAGFASFGAWRVLSSSASTSPYSISMSESTGKGCGFAGRIWNATAPEGDRCQPKCRTAGTKYVPFDSVTKRPGYCQGHVAVEIDQAKCIDQLHRYYVTKVGCARKANQESGNGSKYCQPDYPTYIADGATDRCIKDEIAAPVKTAPVATDGVGAGTVSSGPTTDPITAERCGLLGRKPKDVNNCNRVCLEGAGSLLISSTTTKTAYCSNALATNIGPARCDSLNRKYVDVGCARRVDQKDTVNAPQCVTGYSYYNANFSNKGTVTSTDVCEKSKAAATANEAAGTPAGNAENNTPAPGSSIIASEDGCPEGKVRNARNKCVTAPNPPTEPGESLGTSDPVDATPDGFKITVYKDKEFKGKSKSYTNEQTAIKDGLNDKISSIRVEKGRWSICEDKDYQKCRSFWASDPDLTKAGKENFNDKISSIRPVTITSMEEAPSDINAVCVNASGITVRATSEKVCPEETTLTCPVEYVLQGSECNEEAVIAQNVVLVDKNFKGDEAKRKCELLGREWIGEVKGKTINGGQYGCSMMTCKLDMDGAPRKFKQGPVCISYKYGKAYAQDLGEEKCKNLHRIWIDQVKRCASMPNRKDKDQTKVKAEQCMPGYSTYYIYKAADKEDECFKPKFFQKVQGVAKSTGGSLGSGLQQGPKLFCNSVKGGDFHWTGNACKIDRKKCWNGTTVTVNQSCPGYKYCGVNKVSLDTNCPPVNGGSGADGSGQSDGGTAGSGSGNGADGSGQSGGSASGSGSGGGGCREGGCGPNGTGGGSTPTCPGGYAFDPGSGCPDRGPSNTGGGSSEPSSPYFTIGDGICNLANYLNDPDCL